MNNINSLKKYLENPEICIVCNTKFNKEQFYQTSTFIFECSKCKISICNQYMNPHPDSTDIGKSYWKNILQVFNVPDIYYTDFIRIVYDCIGIEIIDDSSAYIYFFDGDGGGIVTIQLPEHLNILQYVYKQLLDNLKEVENFFCRNL